MSFYELLAFLHTRGLDRLAYLCEKYEASDEIVQLKTMLPAIGAKLRAKGLLVEAPARAAEPETTYAEELVLPYLRELDAALADGGSGAAMETFQRQIKDATARNAYLAVLAA